MTTCQMLCGRCRNEATLTLTTGSEEVHALDLRTLRIQVYRPKPRTVVACGTHRPQLERVAEMHGGTIRERRR